MRPAHENTDDASADKVLLAVADCASGWEGDVRLLGNVRAKDIVRAISEQSREMEVLRACFNAASRGMTYKEIVTLITDAREYVEACHKL